jgi:hypothetical protein
MKRSIMPVTAALLVGAAVLLCPAAVQAEEKSSSFDAAQLEQIIAPIALYPDSLLMQICMAATYPLEVVEAQRWLEANEGLSGEELDEALKEKDWDPSVKSLCGFPDVLKDMSEKLDWTRDLGDAFLSQQSELLDAAQRMRNVAHDAGNLETTKEQTVTVQEDKIIVIEPADPKVIYVPTYSPTVVYTGWSYPSYYYPYWYVPPPPGYGFMAFTAGFVWGATRAAIWGGCRWGWGRSEVNINVNRYNEFNRNTNRNPDRVNLSDRGGGKAGWNHNPEHRKGVNYRNPETAQRFGGSGGNRVTRDQARGYDRAGQRPSTGQRPTTGQRPSAGSRPSQRPSAGTTPSQRPSAGATPSQRPSAGTTPSQRPSAGQASSRSSGGRSSAWSGSSSPSFDRASSNRGSASRGSYSGSGSRGGGSRGGGGRRR